MEKIINKPFETRKKISLDVNIEFLKIIDNLAKLTKCNRTLIIESLLGQGIPPLFDYFEKEWKALLKKEEYKEKKKGIEDVLKNLGKIKEKYKGLIYLLSNLPSLQ